MEASISLKDNISRDEKFRNIFQTLDTDVEFTKKINQDSVIINDRHTYINPKAKEPLELIEGLLPRKVMVDLIGKIFSTTNIETLLKQAVIDFSNENPLDSWLPLEFFEDKDFDIFTAEEWMAKAKDKENPMSEMKIKKKRNLIL